MKYWGGEAFFITKTAYIALLLLIFPFDSWASSLELLDQISLRSNYQQVFLSPETDHLYAIDDKSHFVEMTIDSSLNTEQVYQTLSFCDDVEREIGTEENIEECRDFTGASARRFSLSKDELTLVINVAKSNVFIYKREATTDKFDFSQQIVVFDLAHVQFSYNDKYLFMFDDDCRFVRYDRDSSGYYQFAEESLLSEYIPGQSGSMEDGQLFPHGDQNETLVYSSDGITMPKFLRINSDGSLETIGYLIYRLSITPRTNWAMDSSGKTFFIADGKFTVEGGSTSILERIKAFSLSESGVVEVPCQVDEDIETLGNIFIDDSNKMYSFDSESGVYRKFEIAGNTDIGYTLTLIEELDSPVFLVDGGFNVNKQSQFVSPDGQTLYMCVFRLI